MARVLPSTTTIAFDLWTSPELHGLCKDATATGRSGFALATGVTIACR